MKNKKPTDINVFYKILMYSFLILGVIITLFPFYYMLVGATHVGSEVLSFPPKLTFGSNLMNNINTLIVEYKLPKILFNSLFISTTYMILTLILCSFAGYAFSKYNFKFKGLIFSMLMLTMMIPQQALLVPLFNLMNTIGWSDSYAAVIVPGLANAFGIFLMKQNMDTVSNELIESGRIDGCGEMGIFFKIVLPVVKPSLGALAIYMFMQSWGSFLWPLVILGSQDMMTIPVVLSSMSQVMGAVDYGAIMALSTISVIPLATVFLFMQKQFVAGMTAGAVKG